MSANGGELTSLVDNVRGCAGQDAIFSSPIDSINGPGELRHHLLVEPF